MAKTNEELKQIATQVRRDILRMVCMAKSGHPGGSMSSTDVLTTLYFNEMNQNPATWARLFFDGTDYDSYIAEDVSLEGADVEFGVTLKPGPNEVCLFNDCETLPAIDAMALEWKGQ